ncbi:choice-of-anchor X domain-containing protein [Rhodoferax saidenbachensis]|uniref:Uncharacterized protein n=1 Tax=Rhodoferax saidenbachensis TaxID=1484693 RepID=A0ABU1ZL17_9BURK|nr:choice-of-anchor X domain-containing protein [Rhodoferax saidenbachensis]MDR7306173.1 hypothetical protein [Rhodoferax saidenbachensis]
MMKHARWLAATAIAGLVVGYFFWDASENPATAASTQPLAQAPTAGALTPASDASAPPAPPSSRHQEQRNLWQARYNRAAQTFNSYRDATRYPPTSRPLSEHADQELPFSPILDDRVLLTGPGKVAKGVRLRTSQERVFLSGEESVEFRLQALDDNGAALPMTIRRSTAFNIAETKVGTSLIQSEVPFSDDGAGVDTKANDGIYVARLVPFTQGFAAYSGTIRLATQVNVNGEDGEVSFDVVYTAGVPATWLGVREALENGSLNFYLKAQVLTAGRYVVSARVYDAKGRAFALLQYNEEVAAGAREFKLQLFGALVRDLNPVFPLRLADVEGFLLKPDVFPDRAMMARIKGTAHTTAIYKLDQFSSAEWTSEERTRYLNEYRSDMEKASDALNALQ